MPGREQDALTASGRQHESGGHRVQPVERALRVDRVRPDVYAGSPLMPTRSASVARMVASVQSKPSVNPNVYDGSRRATNPMLRRLISLGVPTSPAIRFSTR